MDDVGRIRALCWDAWNLEHIAKHGMEPDDAAEVVWGSAIVEVPGEPGSFYVFSARPASRQERRRYVNLKGRSLL